MVAAITTRPSSVRRRAAAIGETLMALTCSCPRSSWSGSMCGVVVLVGASSVLVDDSGAVVRFGDVPVVVVV